MLDRESTNKHSWIFGALAGGLIGGFVGVLYLLDEFSYLGVASAAAAGAVFYSAIGAFAKFLSNPAIMFLASGLFGAIAGLAWAEIRSVPLTGPVTYGLVLGFIVAIFEGGVFSSSKDGQ